MGIQQGIRIGLIRDGEAPDQTPDVMCDGIILRGAIQASLGSCAGTGVLWEQSVEQPHLSTGGVRQCQFQTAGFVVLWGGQAGAAAVLSNASDAVMSRMEIRIS